MLFSTWGGFVHPISYYLTFEEFSAHLNKEIIFLYKKKSARESYNPIYFDVKDREVGYINSLDKTLTQRYRKGRHYSQQWLGTENDGVNIFDDILRVEEYKKHGIIFNKHIFAQSHHPGLSIDSGFMPFMKKRDREIYINSQVSLDTDYRNKGIELNEDVRAGMNDKSSFLNSVDTIKKSDDYGIDIGDSLFLGYRLKGLTDINKYNSIRMADIDEGLEINKMLELGQDDGKALAINKDMFLGMHSKCLYNTNNAIHLGTDNISLNIDKYDHSVGIHNKKLNNIKEYIFSGLDNKAIDQDSINYFLNKDNLDLNTNGTSSMLYKHSESINIENNLLFINKDESAVNLSDSFKLLNKESYGIEFDNDNVRLSRTSYALNNDDSYKRLFKDERKLHIDDTFEFVKGPDGTKKGIYFLDNKSFSKIEKDMYINTDVINLSKNYHSVYDEGNLIITKNYHTTDVGNENIGFTVLNRPLNIYEDYKTFCKGSRDIYINNDMIFADKLHRDIFKSDDSMHLDKLYHNVFQNITDILATKNMKNTGFEYNDTFITKNMHNAAHEYHDIFATKGRKKAFREYYDTWATKMRKKAFREYYDTWATKGRRKAYRDYYDMWATKCPKVFSLNESGEFVTKKNYNIDFYNKDLSVDKLGVNTGVSSDFIGFIKDAKVIDFQDIVTAVGKARETLINNNNSFATLNNKSFDTHIKDIWFEYEKTAIINEEFKTIYKGNISITMENILSASGKDKSITESENMHLEFNRKHTDYQRVDSNVSKRRKDVHIDYKNIFTHVIHYKDDDSKPSKDLTGNIDELIMPHKDYTYNEFLSKLILPNGSVNPAHVTGYDPATNRYIVNLPIENPIKIYADIARDYLDVDTGIMGFVIYLIKSIWRKNMYKYITMYADEALEDILKLLNSEIDREYGTRDQSEYDQALRCLQLFRWYSEMAVLNNCEYELSFDTREIRVDYANKNLAEFRNMTILNNMYISENYILEAIDKTKPCSVTFVNTKKHITPKLDLHFKLYNVNSKSSISVIEDGNIAETVYEPGIYDLDLELKDKIVIVYDPSTTYQNMAIAGLSISNLPTRNFTVTYKGKFGNINPVMQELLDKMLVTNTASADVQEKFKNVAPTTVAIDTIIQYFELHHQDKLKGKRLTIKK